MLRELIYRTNCYLTSQSIGSFVNSDDPHDMDVAVFQDSNEAYLPLAMKYRKKTNEVSDIIPLDIIPLKSQIKTDPFLSEISNGEVIYER